MRTNTQPSSRQEGSLRQLARTFGKQQYCWSYQVEYKESCVSERCVSVMTVVSNVMFMTTTQSQSVFFINFFFHFFLAKAC